MIQSGDAVDEKGDRMIEVGRCNCIVGSFWAGRVWSRAGS
jgi:hypothetical protein